MHLWFTVCSDAGMAGGQSSVLLTAFASLTLAVVLLTPPALAATAHTRRALLQGAYGSAPTASQPGVRSVFVIVKHDYVCLFLLICSCHVPRHTRRNLVTPGQRGLCRISSASATAASVTLRAPEGNSSPCSLQPQCFGTA
jgi:hypothetical protein